MVIWETGLGGRLDATNIVTPLASVITNIAFDHQQWLGDTLEKIAAEKAGIIKPGVPVITATDAPEALQVIEAVAHKNSSSCLHVKAERRYTHGQLPVALLGAHQKNNAALALATVKVLQPQIPVTVENTRVGLATVSWPGRLQLITRPSGQRILLDGAHNLAGAEALRVALEQDFADSRPVLIFGALADKQWTDICRTLGPLAHKILTVPVVSERTASAEALADAFRSVNAQAQIIAGESLAHVLKRYMNRSHLSL